MIELDELEYAYDTNEIDDYLVQESYIDNADWNNRGIKLLHIAFYIILNNPKPKKDIDEKRLAQIRKTVCEVKLNILNKRSKALSSEWFTEAYNEEGNSINGKTFHELNIEGRLGKFAKYFIRHSNKPHSKDIENKYIFQRGAYILDCMNGTKDEIQIIKEFLDHVEEEKNDYMELYKNVRAYNQNTTCPELKPSNIDESLKSNLLKRLSKLNLTESKLQRILSSTIKAIKKEILQLK